MLKTLHLSTAGRLSLALAIFLGLVAVASLTAARGGLRAATGGRSGGLSADAFAQGVPPVPGQPAAGSGIAVVGEGEVSGTPDVAQLNLGVQTEGKTAREAMDQNSATMAAVVDAIKRGGVPDNKIRTTGINLNPIQAQPRPGDQGPPQVTGYRASNTVNVSVDGVAKTGDVLDAAVGAGANVANGVRFAIGDPTPLRRQALDAAAQDARKNADALAAALGLHVTGVLSVSEDTGGVQPFAPAALAADARAGGAPVQPGEVTVRARVRVVFTFA